MEHHLAWLNEAAEAGGGTAELLHVERSFRRGMTKHLLDASESLGALAERLRSFDDDECRSLAERVEAFVLAVRGA